MEVSCTIILIAGIFFAAFVWLISFIPFGDWLKAHLSGVRLDPITLICMKFRGTRVQLIINAMIMGTQANLQNIYINELEAHYLAGGHIDILINALIQAQKANIPLSFKQACAIDLAGRNVLEAVNMSVNPRVIKTPLIGAIAKDGIQIKATASITVKANINKLIGGAGEDTVVARVGEGICTAIGSAETYAEVRNSPALISQTVLKKGLDVGTAFEILSIDIADIDVGKNIGSELQIQQANADKNIAQAKAEQKRALAIALEQEMKAQVVEMEANLIESEAQVPLAVAKALREGKIGTF